jgi:transcriptional regulator with XRE-family HTH domain
MKLRIHRGLAFLLGMMLAVPCFAGEIVDRVIANVNGHILLQSDWEQELALEALLNGRPVDSFTPAERKAALDRLIDRELLREQVRPSEAAPAGLVAARVTEVRKLLPNAATDEGWRTVLLRHGLTQSALEKRLGEEIQLMRLVEARLRPSIQIDQHAVETYYHDELLPQLKRTGGREVALPEVFGHIKDLLAEQRLNQLLSGWLASLRSASQIQTPPSLAGVENP